jgi:hypothetical protein
VTRSRPLCCFDRLEPVVQPNVLPKHQPERARSCRPATSRLYRLYIIRQARPPPAVLPRPRVGTRPVCRHMCSRQIQIPLIIRASVLTQMSYFARSLVERSAYGLRLSFVASASSAASSQPAALPRSPWQKPAGPRPHLASLHFEQLDRTLVLPPRACFDRVCGAVPRACNGQAVFSSIEALACSTPTNRCCSRARRKEECESREENLPAGDRGGPKRQEASWKRHRK